MTLQDEISILDPFTYTEDDHNKTVDFDFIREKKSEKIEKVKIDQTFCTLVTVGGKFLEKKNFKQVLKKIDDIRKIIR